jgi:hypothetical protein
MTADDILTLDISSTGEVFSKHMRLVHRSIDPMLSAGRKLRDMKFSGDVVIHFRRFGKVVRTVSLDKLLQTYTKAVTP